MSGRSFALAPAFTCLAALATLAPSSHAQGEIVGWGRDTHGQVSLAPTGSTAVQVAGGDMHAVALMADGSVVSWGDDTYGQVSGTPSGSDFRQVAAGEAHSVALTNTGSIVAWGTDSWSLVTSAPTGTGFKQVACGWHHSVAIAADGSLVAWGRDSLTQVSSTPSGTGFIQVAAGRSHSVALHSDGSLVTWGWDEFGQVSGVPAGDQFVEIAAGINHNLALRQDGTCGAWGRDNYGQVSGPLGAMGLQHVAAGDQHSIAIRADGSLRSWGREFYGQISATPTGAGFTDVSGGWHFALALRSVNAGGGFCFGDGGDQMGCTNCPCSNEAAPGVAGGCINSAADSARLLVSGDPSVSLPFGSTQDLRFALAGAPSLAFCILNSGDALAPQNPANPCFGLGSGVRSVSYDGLRCAVGNERRQGGRAADGEGKVGFTNSPWGGESAPVAGIANAGSGYAAGQSRFFQVVYRDDPLLVCSRGLNTSQAVSVAFTP